MVNRLGRYELRRVIGRGAAGTVWEALDTVLERRVAIKVVRTGGAGDLTIEEMSIRFRQEAQLASRFSHPGVVQVYDYGEIDGQAFIVMEFVEGETLKALLDRGGRLPLARTAEIMCGVLLALEPCHRQNIVHRDIKPGNIMLPAEGGVKLTDFGIARMENSELTIVGTVMGTPSYMSPEQFTAAHPADYRSDIWSAGVVLYEMLTGARPFAGTSIAAIGQSVVNDDFEPPSRRTPEVPATLDQVVARALRKAPAGRFPGAPAFRTALREAVPALGAAAPRPPGSGGSRANGVTVAVLAMLLAAGSAWWWLSGDREEAPPATTLGMPLDDRVAGLACTAVKISRAAGMISFRGIAGEGAPRAALDKMAAELPAGTAVLTVQNFPNKALSCRLADLARRNAGPGGARLTVPGGQGTLYNGDEIRLRLTMPDFAGEARLDDLNSDGQVTHLMEGNGIAPPYHPAGVTIGLGHRGAEAIGLVNPPYGVDLFVAIVSSEPLLPGSRPVEEAGGPFIEELDAAMTALRRRGGRVAVDALAVTTARR